MAGDDMLTTKEAAERRGISGGRIRQLYLQGRLAGTKRGVNLFFKTSDVDALEIKAPYRPRTKRKYEKREEG